MGIVALAMTLIYAAPTVGAATDVVALAEDTVDDATPEELAQLAGLFSETVGAVVVSAALEGLSCGESGHCNIMTCDIDCPTGTSKSCACDPTNVKCKDTHNGMNPFDNDEHNMYSCQCDCIRDPPPPPPPPTDPECIVKVGPVCVEETADKLVTAVRVKGDAADTTQTTQ